MKMLMLVMIESCQNTQCIAVCCVWGCKGAHAEPCPLPKVPTMGTSASELDHRAMEEGGLVWSDGSRFLLHHMDPRGEHMAPESTTGRRHAGRGNVMLWAMFCWEILGPAVHVTLTRTTHLSIVADWFEEHNNQFKVLTWPPNSPDLNPIEHLRDVLDKQV